MVDMPQAVVMNPVGGMPMMGIMPVNTPHAQAKMLQEVCQQQQLSQTRTEKLQLTTFEQRYVKLKELGTPDHDPELQRVRQMLTQISQHQKKLRDEHARRQASAQAQQQQPQNGINGANGNG